MKRTLLRFLAIILAVILLTACQATPDNPVVIQKDLEQMIDKAQKSPEAYGGTLAERLGAPESLQTELKSTKGKLNVHVDASLALPDVQELPTVRVGMGGFTQGDVMRLYETLCGDATPVDPLDTQLTQGYKMRIIQSLMEQKESGKLDKYESMEELDAAIKQVMQEVEGLPVHFERVEPNFTFEPQGDGGEALALRVAPDDETLSDLHIYNAAEGMGQSRVEYYRDLSYIAPLSFALSSGAYYSGRETQSPYFVSPEISEEHARKLAEDTITALKLSDFVCSASRMDALYHDTADAEDAPRQGVYEFMFTRKVAGVTITYTGDAGSSIDRTQEMTR